MKEKPVAPEARQHILRAERTLTVEVRNRLDGIVPGEIINAIDAALLELQSARRGLRAYRVRRKSKHQ